MPSPPASPAPSSPSRFFWLLRCGRAKTPSKPPSAPPRPLCGSPPASSCSANSHRPPPCPRCSWWSTPPISSTSSGASNSPRSNCRMTPDSSPPRNFPSAASSPISAPDSPSLSPCRPAPAPCCCIIPSSPASPSPPGRPWPPSSRSYPALSNPGRPRACRAPFWGSPSPCCLPSASPSAA